MAVISWDNYLDDATLTNNSDGAEVLGIAKLKTRQLGDVFRQSIDATPSPVDELIVDINLGSAKLTTLVCILNHDMAGLDYTLDFGTSSGGSQVGTETGTFDTLAASDATNEMLYYSTGYTAQYVRLTVKVPTVRTVEIGRIWLDDAWSTTASLEFSVSVVDPSPITKSRGGSVFISERKRARRLIVKAFGLTENEFRGTVGDSLYKSYLTMDLSVGSSGELVFLPLTDSQINRNRLGVYGHVINNLPMKVLDKRNSDGLMIEKRFTLEEDF